MVVTCYPGDRAHGVAGRLVGQRSPVARHLGNAFLDGTLSLGDGSRVRSRASLGVGNGVDRFGQPLRGEGLD